MTIEEIFPPIKQKIEEALGRNRAEGILLSGGIDSGILAYLYPQAKAITVSLEGRGRDGEYASSLATTFGLAHTVITIDLEEALVATRGYSYMQEIEDLDGYVRRISRSMSFSSERIGHHFGIDVKRPYLDETFINFALTLKKEVKIRKEKGHVWGKWVLRKSTLFLIFCSDIPLSRSFLAVLRHTRSMNEYILDVPVPLALATEGCIKPLESQ